jgi:Ser/Thr protein kinase RdoA (MazF antagonist)
MNTSNMTVNVSECLGHNSYQLREAFTQVPNFVKTSESYRKVICHGDLWMNNIMYNYINSPPICLLMDFQLIRYALLVSDIAQLIYMNLSKVFRRKYEKKFTD